MCNTSYIDLIVKIYLFLLSAMSHCLHWPITCLEYEITFWLFKVYVIILLLLIKFERHPVFKESSLNSGEKRLNFVITIGPGS